MRDQLQPTLSLCIDLSHQNAFFRKNHLTAPSSPPKHLPTVAYMCSPNESMSQASTPINSQSVSENRSLTRTHARTPILTTVTLSGATNRVKSLAGEAISGVNICSGRYQTAAEAPSEPRRAATSAPCLPDARKLGADSAEMSNLP